MSANIQGHVELETPSFFYYQTEIVTAMHSMSRPTAEFA